MNLLSVTFILFFSSGSILNAALPPLDKAQLNERADVVIEGQVLKVEKERKSTGFFSSKLVKDHYVITIGKFKVIKSLKEMKQEELKIMGERVIERPGVGPVGHTNITILKKGDTIRAHCIQIKDKGLFFMSPNGIKVITEKEEN